MSVQTISDVLSRVSAIQQQLQQLQAGTLLDAATATGGVAVSGTPAQGVTPSTAGSTDFASALTRAQAQVQTQSGTGNAGAGNVLTSDQQQFASTLSAATGLNPSVVRAWLLAEESGGAAQARQAAGNNDWLNIGYTGAGTYGATDSVWSDPVSAANATAQWIEGQRSISGYGTASAGIQAILQSVGQSPSAQIAAIQSSGWAGSGYPTLQGLYEQVSG